MSNMVYMQLCVILDEPDEHSFNSQLECFIRKLYEKGEISFAHYFEEDWVPVREEWSKCHRVGAEINTNMFLESFHRFLNTGLSENNLQEKGDIPIPTSSGDLPFTAGLPCTGRKRYRFGNSGRFFPMTCL
ncbi:hypothetical protein JTE90_019409 [Oedothorax gibbosus]|uniref:Uncharacterized protein n=1 Tax=Oedothorax gibbosus TaxID=931172 RepID=A0AAV6TUD4_9ARAC|nr:hypothetical protein JTE90_019409 [Oedothorax gibbosus]